MVGKYKGKNLWGNTVGLKSIRTTEEEYNELSEAEKARTDVVYVYKKVIKSFLMMADKIGYTATMSVKQKLDALDDVLTNINQKLNSLESNKLQTYEQSGKKPKIITLFNKYAQLNYTDNGTDKVTYLVTKDVYDDIAFRHRGFYPNGQSMLTQKQGTYQLTPNNQPSQGRPNNFSEYAALMVMNDGYPIILYIDVFGSFAIWNSKQGKWVTH